MECGSEFKAQHSKRKYCTDECYRKSLRPRYNEITIFDDYAELKITSKTYGEYTTIIDIEDIEKVNKYTWGLCFSKKLLYVRGKQKINGVWKNINLHRFLMDCPDGMVIDHLDRNTLNNRKNNIRVCTNLENQQNKGIYQRSLNKLKGAYYRTDGDYWYSTLVMNKKHIWLGVFKTELEAHTAYVKAKKERNIICKETVGV